MLTSKTLNNLMPPKQAPRVAARKTAPKQPRQKQAGRLKLSDAEADTIFDYLLKQR